MARTRLTRYAIMDDDKSKDLSTEDLSYLYAVAGGDVGADPQTTSTKLCVICETKEQADALLFKMQGGKYQAPACVVREVSVVLGPIVSRLKLAVVDEPRKVKPAIAERAIPSAGSRGPTGFGYPEEDDYDPRDPGTDL